MKYSIPAAICWSRGWSAICPLPPSELASALTMLGEESVKATALRIRRVWRDFGRRFPREGGRLLELFRESSNRRSPMQVVAILLECRGDGVGFLNSSISMMQKHIDGCRDFRVSQLVHRGNNPCRFHEN